MAIGAPFGGPDGNGIVYLYNGGKNGIRTQYTQVRTAVYTLDLVNFLFPY